MILPMKKLLLLTMTTAVCLTLQAQTGIFPGPTGQANNTPSGVFGQCYSFEIGGPGSDFLPPPSGTPTRTHVSIYDSTGKLAQRIISNPVGQFYWFIKPGTYTLVPSLPGQRLPPPDLSQYVPPSGGNVPVATNQTVTVNARQLRQVEIDYRLAHP
jgi:hypothetical protein